MIHEEHYYPEEFQQKLEAFETLQKAFDLGKVDIHTFSRAYDLIEKAKKDISRLTKIQKIIIKDGRPVLATFYVKPDGSEVEDESKRKTALHKDVPEVAIGSKVDFILKSDKRVQGTLTRISDRGGYDYTKFYVETSPGEFTSFRSTVIRRIVPVKDDAKILEKPKPKLDYSDFSFDFSKIEKVKDLGGSGNNYLAKDEAGRLFTIKNARERETGVAQIYDEVVSDKIYRSMGFDAPHSMTALTPEGKAVKVAKYIEGVKEYNSLASSAKEVAKKEIQKGFVLDCLLANWDVIGASYDNILCSSDGSKVMRVDNGGSLRYRAKGSPKGSLWNETVSEIDTLRDRSKNPTAHEIFSSITDEEIVRQVKELNENWPTIIGSFKDAELKKMLNLRLENLESRFSDSSLKAKVEEEKRKEEARKKEEEKRKKEEEESKKLGIYPSLVTKNYFESDKWKNLKIDGNEGIKESIKKKIMEIERRYDSSMSSGAIKRGESVEEYKRKLQEKITEFVQSSECFIAVHSQRDRDKSVMEKIFNDGKFKTQFETGTSEGALSPSSRMNAEYSYFEFPKERGKGLDDKRPVYGYFSTHESGVINQEGKIPPPNHVSQYGDVSFKIKKSSAMKKATITFSDSLGRAGDQSATPYAMPHFTSFLSSMPSGEDPIAFLDKAIRNKTCGNRYSYVETQYHGGLTLDDVESLNITPGSFRGESGDKMKKLSSAVNSIMSYAAKTGKTDLIVNIF